MTILPRNADLKAPASPKQFLDIVRNFTPNWFTVTMGTGGLALCLNQFPSHIPGAGGAAVMLWLADIILFAAFTLVYAARWAIFPHEARRIFDHPVMSMFFGAVPMGLATIINGFLAFGPSLIGDAAAVATAHTLWWIDAAMSLASGLVIPYFMFTRQDHRIERMTAVWLLPIVAAEVAAASAGSLAPHLATSEAFSVLMLGYALWAYSTPLAMSVLVLLFLRLALHKLPESDMGASAWLALGPIGTGALGLILLGDDAPAIFAANDLADVGRTAQGVGIVGGVIFWGYGAWWLGLAVLKTIRYIRQGLPFNLGWWGFTFPLAVYAMGTLALGRTTHLALFDVAGSVLVICLAVFWSIVASRTAHGAWRGYLFVSPCLKGASSPPVKFESDVV